MIRINLLPHRELARKLRRDRFKFGVGVAALLGLLLALLVFLVLQVRIAEQAQRNQQLQTEISRLDGQIKDIAGLQTEITALLARQQAVEDLQADRNLPVMLMSELARQLPEGLFLSSVRQDAQNLTLSGTAQSNERVSELLRNLGNNSPALSRPELIEIVAGTLALSPREQRRVANFTIRVHLVRSSDAAVIQPAPGVVLPAAPASAPKSGKT
ncbi:MAG: PilN domain-containing protein [Betaproteobacteria bacterium]